MFTRKGANLTENARSHIHFQKSNALPLEPVPQNHFGPTDASKGHSFHGEHDGSWGEPEYNQIDKITLNVKKASHDEIRQNNKPRTTNEDKRHQRKLKRRCNIG